MKLYKKAIGILLPALAFAACSKPADEPAVSPQAVSSVFRTVAAYGSMTAAGRESAFVSDSVALKAYAKYMTGREDTDAREVLLFLSESQPVRVFTPAVDSVFISLAPLENALGGILKRAEASGLHLPRRRYAAVVHGRSSSVVFVDSVMLIALNHYLGAAYPGYSHWPAYRRADKTPARLPYDLAEALVATEYPYSPSESTVLSRMLYEGVLSLVRQTLAGGDRAASLGYDGKQMDMLEEHEAELWKILVGRGLLYDTSAMTADRLFAPAPATTLLGSGIPGRAGRFIGRCIVDAYIDRHPEVTLSYLLSPDFYASPSALADAGYNPAVG